jgi:hypothetical protein
MLTFGVVFLGVTDRRRAEGFWCAALGYEACLSVWFSPHD